MMDLKPNHHSPVLNDQVSSSKSRIGLPTNLVPYSSTPAALSSSSIHLMTPKKKPMPGKLEDVRAGGWLDAMSASSPTCKTLGMDFGSGSVPDEADAAYRSWTLKYPSAITSFEHIVGNAKGKQIALFLDYDGTLSPIVDEPDHAFMSNSMRSAVRNVAKYFPTAIISGRSRDKVYEFVRLNELHYAGSHGMDIMGPVRGSAAINDHPSCITTTNNQGKEVNVFQPASEFIPMIEEVSRSLIENIKGIVGAKVENNRFCVSVHYRLVDEKSWPEVAQCVHDIIKDYPRLRLTHGRRVLEIRPVIDWNKGKAVEFLLESLGLNNRDDVIPIYIGDDRTDEDAFRILREGKRGYGILVSPKPKETSAFYSLRDPSEVMAFLKTLARWKRLAAFLERNKIPHSPKHEEFTQENL